MYSKTLCILVVCRVLCVRVVGATSSEGCLVLSVFCQYDSPICKECRADGEYEIAFVTLCIAELVSSVPTRES